MRLALADDNCPPLPKDARPASSGAGQVGSLPVELLNVAPAAVLQLRQGLRRVLNAHLHATAHRQT